MTHDYQHIIAELADRLRLLHSSVLEVDGTDNEALRRAYQAVIDDLKRAEEVRKRMKEETA